MDYKLNKNEIKCLAKFGYKVKENSNIEDVRGLVVDGLIIISNGIKKLHESGYPFIKIFGIVGRELYFLGWHDNYISNIPVNTDSFGKNIFHIFPWIDKLQRKWKVSDSFISLSTFQIGENMYVVEENKNYIILN